MRLFVTGSTGFIGSWLVKSLRERGHEVLAASGRVESEIKLEGCEGLVHLANLAHTTADPLEVQRVNVDGTRRIAEKAARLGVRRFVYVSSIKAASPDEPYGLAKIQAERALSQLKNLEVCVLRPPLVYGPKVKANFLALMRAIDRGIPLPLANVTNRRSLVFVGNVAHAITTALEHPAAVGKTFALSDGDAVSTPALCRAIAASLGRPARLLPFPVSVLRRVPPLRKLTDSLEVDDGPLRRELDWKPAYSFEEGLRHTTAWYRSARTS